MGGVKYNSLNSTFKIDIKKGLDSEIQIAEIVLTVRVSAHSVERMKSYTINTFFSMPNGKIQQCVISKHNHVHVKKRLDSEDADHRDSINRFIFSSFCRADEKLYNKHCLFLAKWQDPTMCNFQA